MLDALLADEAFSQNGRLIVRCGRALFSFDCSPRDQEALSDQEGPVQVHCDIELDLSTPSSAQLVALAFASPERRQLYRDVRTVNGIGRGSALSVLDSGEVRDTLRAVAGADLSYFQSVPGLGRKKAEAVISGLKSRYQGYLPKAITVPVATLVEARDALVSAGENADSAEHVLLASLDTGQVPKSAEAWLALL